MSFLGEQEDWWQHIRWFKRTDVRCQCGCGTQNASFEIMWLADRIREKYAELLFDRFNDPDGRLVVASGCRCPQHNLSRNVGGSPFSYHIAIPDRLDCSALDLRPPIRTEEQNRRNLDVLYEAVQIIKPPGYKLYSSWVHIDFRQGKFRG